MRGKRGQISTEYLILTGFIVAFVIIILGAAIYYSSQIEDTIRTKQIEQFANKVVGSAASVYYSGEPSKTTINAYLPKGVSQITILEREIVFNYTSVSGENDVSYLSKVPISGSITSSSGIKRIEIVAFSDGASITGN